MPAVYPEPNPLEEFTIADWKEAIDGVKPGAGGSFNCRSGTDTIVVRVPGFKIRSMRKFVVGYSRAYSGAPYTLFRTNPPAHPEFPEMRATDMHVVRKAPMRNPDRTPLLPDKVWRYSDDPAAAIPRYAMYETAEVAVTFKLYPYEHKEDGDSTWGGLEYQRNASLFHETTPSLETMMAETGGPNGVLKWAESGPGGKPTAGAVVSNVVAEYLSKCQYVLAWWGVHEKFILDDYRPAKLTAGIGCVNNEDFLGFAAGTLKMNAPRLDRYRAPLWGDEPVILYDCYFPMEEYDPVQGATSPVARGHNTLINRDTGKAFLATRGGGTGDPRLLPGSHFDNIFSHVLDASKPVRL